MANILFYPQYHWVSAENVASPGLYFLYRTDDEELTRETTVALIEVWVSDLGSFVYWKDGLQEIVTLDPECRFLGPISRNVEGNNGD